jgi:hypothetical protein
MRRALSILAAVLGVIGVLGVLVSVVGIWAHQVLFKPGEVSAAVDQALLEPEVTEALADRLTEQVLAAVSIEDLVEDRLPSSLDDLAPLFVGGITTVVNEGLTRVLDSDAAREVITGATERAHRAVMAILDEGGLVEGLTVVDGAVTVNLLPLLGRGFDRLQQAGLLQDVDLPELERGGDPAEQIEDLEAALDRDLPDDFGQLVVYQSESLAAAKESVARAQQALAVVRRGILLVLVLTVACLVGSTLLAANRRRALLALGLGTAAAMAIGRAVIRTVEREAPSVATRPGGRAAIDAIVSSLADGLLTALMFMLLVGLVLAGVMFLRGSSRPAQAFRGTAAATGSSVRAVVDQHRDGVAVGAFAVAVVVILIAGLSVGSLLVALAFTGVGAWLLWANQPPAESTPGP